MAGNKQGAIRIAARTLGLTEGAYLARIAAGEKWCTRCKSWQPLDRFGVDRSRGDGRTAACQSCRHQRSTTGPGKGERQVKAAQGLSWCRRCDSWLPSALVRAGVCRTHANEEARERYKASPEVRHERRQHAHSRKRAVAPLPVAAAAILMEEFDGQCAYCGQPATTWDHIVPVVKGGETTPENTVPACVSCNSSKRDRDLFDWLAATGRTPHDRLIDRLALAYC